MTPVPQPSDDLTDAKASNGTEQGLRYTLKPCIETIPYPLDVVDTAGGSSTTLGFFLTNGNTDGSSGLLFKMDFGCTGGGLTMACSGGGLAGAFLAVFRATTF